MTNFKEQQEFINWINEESDAHTICKCGHLISQHNIRGCFYGCKKCTKQNLGKNEFDGGMESPNVGSGV
jgi:hypothetical protein